MTHKEWPFIEAQRIIDRLQQDRHAVGHRGNRVRPLGPPPHRHVRRGRPDLLRAAGAVDAGARHHVAHHRFLRRHGRPARGAEEPPQRADAAAAPRQAADLHPRSLRRGEVVRPLHEPPAARVPGLVRVPLRVRLLHRHATPPACSTRACAGSCRTTTRSATCSRRPSRRRSARPGARSSPSARTAGGCTPRA